MLQVQGFPIVVVIVFFAYRTLASYYNGLLCHMRALSHVLYRIHSSCCVTTYYIPGM